MKNQLKTSNERKNTTFEASKQKNTRAFKTAYDTYQTPENQRAGKFFDIEKTCVSYYDYGFRQLDPQLGRWHVVDALAERYFSVTPYAYVNNNPINTIDLLGLTPYVPQPWIKPDGYMVHYGSNSSHESIIPQHSDWMMMQMEFNSLWGSEYGGTWSRSGGTGYFDGGSDEATNYVALLPLSVSGITGFYGSVDGNITSLYIDGVGRINLNSGVQPWNPADPTKGHFAPDFSTLVNYMYNQSPVEGREFAAYILGNGGTTYYYLLPRDGNIACECNFSYQEHSGKFNIASTLYDIILGIHTHNSCNDKNGYQGPSYNDYTTARGYNADALIIGDTDISYLRHEAYYSERHFNDLRSQRYIIDNPFRVANTSSWLLNPTYNFP